MHTSLYCPCSRATPCWPIGFPLHIWKCYLHSAQLGGAIARTLPFFLHPPVLTGEREWYRNLISPAVKAVSPSLLPLIGQKQVESIRAYQQVFSLFIHSTSTHLLHCDRSYSRSWDGTTTDKTHNQNECMSACDKWRKIKPERAIAGCGGGGSLQF